MLSLCKVNATIGTFPPNITFKCAPKFMVNISRGTPPFLNSNTTRFAAFNIIFNLVVYGGLTWLLNFKIKSLIVFCIAVKTCLTSLYSPGGIVKL